MRSLWQLFLFFTPFLHGSICLNMIVKDEEAVIGACLESVKPWIDYWVIVDTGSRDATIEKIKTLLKEIPGELHQRPWVDFETNRNVALDLAKDKGDYLLFIDADEKLVFDEHFSLPPLQGEDGYHIKVRQIGAIDFLRPSLVRAALPWKWEGKIHEVLTSAKPVALATLPGVINLCNDNALLSGRGLNPAKYARDVALCEALVAKEPHNARYVYYLAQSYAAAEDHEKAFLSYQKRSSMPSTDFQETFFSFYYAGKSLEKLGDLPNAIHWYLQARSFYPLRAEPLFRAAICCRELGYPFLGFLLTQYALKLPFPHQDNCIEYLTYDHELLIEHANCALVAGLWDEGLKACELLLQKNSLPPDKRVLVLSNRNLARTNLGLAP